MRLDDRDEIQRGTDPAEVQVTVRSWSSSKASVCVSSRWPTIRVPPRPVCSSVCLRCIQHVDVADGGHPLGPPAPDARQGLPGALDVDAEGPADRHVDVRDGGPVLRGWPPGLLGLRPPGETAPTRGSEGADGLLHVVPDAALPTLIPADDLPVRRSGPIRCCGRPT